MLNLATSIPPVTNTSPMRRLADRVLAPGNIHAASIRAATVILVVLAYATVPHFTDFGNVQSILYSIAAVGVGAVGMGVVTINGNLFMLSMGATAAASTVMFASVIHVGLGPTLDSDPRCSLWSGPDCSSA